jgi:hypothetical protein
MNPSNCPKFFKCNAPICPLDANWEKRVLLNEDPTCFYLSEFVKDNSQSNFECAGAGEIYQVIERVAPPITGRHPRIRIALERAKLSGSRMTITPPSVLGGKGE